MNYILISFWLVASAAVCMPAVSFAQASTSASTSAYIVTPGSLAKEKDLKLDKVSVSNASFLVSGRASYTYSITLPASCVTIDGAPQDMTVDNFISVPAVTGMLSAGGTETIKVGAKLSVATAQTICLYSSSVGVPITVNYN